MLKHASNKNIVTGNLGSRVAVSMDVASDFA
jgi:hypothetical protein